MKKGTTKHGAMRHQTTKKNNKTRKEKQKNKNTEKT
jgi:hypothetical protein